MQMFVTTTPTLFVSLEPKEATMLAMSLAVAREVLRERAMLTQDEQRGIWLTDVEGTLSTFESGIRSYLGPTPEIPREVEH